MSWDQVEAAIRFWPQGIPWSTSTPANTGQAFSDAQQSQILTNLAQLYAFSATNARILLEQGISGGRQISIYQTPPSVPGLAPSPLGNGVVGVSLTSFCYINSNGMLVQEDPRLVIIHELYHAIAQDRDPTGTGPLGRVTDADLNNPAFNDAGATVTDTNRVAQEMGLTNNNRVAYDASILDTDPRFSELRTDISYSDGQVVTIARFGDLLSRGEPPGKGRRSRLTPSPTTPTRSLPINGSP
jgi:hypothetical protein